MLSAWTTGPSDPIMGQPCTVDPGQKPDPAKVFVSADAVPTLLGAGALPRLGQGHPSSAAAPLGPSLDRARPALAEGQGCG